MTNITVTPAPPALRLLSPLLAAAMYLVTLMVVGVAAVAAVGLFGFRTLTVETASLEPDAARWAVLVQQTVSPAQLRAGDMISFTGNTNPGVVFTQRVVAVEPQADLVKLLTRPVGKDGEERVWQVNPLQPVGRVVAQVPLVGFALQLVDHPAVLAGLIALGLAVMGLRSRLTGERVAEDGNAEQQ